MQTASVRGGWDSGGGGARLGLANRCRGSPGLQRGRRHLAGGSGGGGVLDEGVPSLALHLQSWRDGRRGRHCAPEVPGGLSTGVQLTETSGTIIAVSHDLSG